MALRIACDLDGTLADMDAALQQEARRLFGDEVDLHAPRGAHLDSAEDVERELGPGHDADAADLVVDAGTRPLTHGELRQLWSHVLGIEDFWASLAEIEPGMVRRLADTAARHRWEVIFLTQRPPSAGATAQVQSQRWLRAHGFEFPSVFVMSGSRGKVAHAFRLDAVMDDRVENCMDVGTDSDALPLLIWRQPPEAFPPGLTRTPIIPLYSMADALDRLESLTAERVRSRTLVGRLRNAIRF